MGIDYDGGMIVGNYYDKIDYDRIPDDLDDDYEWLEDQGMSYMSPYYDCLRSECIIGFKIDDIDVNEMNEEWFNMIKEKAKKFKDITGIDAKLIGTQDIW